MSSPFEQLQHCALPPHHTPSTLWAAITDLRTLLGPDHISIIKTNNLQDQSYHDPPKTHDPFHIHSQDSFAASLTIRPGSTADIQSIVKLANTHLLPL
ncbi:hypothetical protein K440DRAFT_631692 [Wilcoxina mikolae CBS 423.85]|nr:hypothetical protein K440DRAFT_631692 [Wilcoxina mikolae CBS 423.85]